MQIAPNGRSISIYNHKEALGFFAHREIELLNIALDAEHKTINQVKGFDSRKSYTFPYGNMYKGSIENGLSSDWIYFTQNALVNFAGAGTTNKHIYKQSMANNYTVGSREVSFGYPGDLRRAAGGLAYTFKNKMAGAATWADELFFNGAVTNIPLTATFKGYLPHQPFRFE